MSLALDLLSRTLLHPLFLSQAPLFSSLDGLFSSAFRFITPDLGLLGKGVTLTTTERVSCSRSSLENSFAPSFSVSSALFPLTLSKYLFNYNSSFTLIRKFILNVSNLCSISRVEMSLQDPVFGLIFRMRTILF